MYKSDIISYLIWIYSLICNYVIGCYPRRLFSSAEMLVSIIPFNSWIAGANFQQTTILKLCYFFK